MTERNRKLFYEIADLIEENPDHYYQADWAAPAYGAEFRNEAEAEAAASRMSDDICGSTCCIAGWAIVLTALERGITTQHRPTVYSFEGYDKRPVYTIDGTQWLGELSNEVIGRVTTFSRAASELLGLTASEGSHLFAGGWMPETGLTVPEALRKIADGADVFDV